MCHQAKSQDAVGQRGQGGTSAGIPRPYQLPSKARRRLYVGHVPLTITLATMATRTACRLLATRACWWWQEDFLQDFEELSAYIQATGEGGHGISSFSKVGPLCEDVSLLTLLLHRPTLLRMCGDM